MGKTIDLEIVTPERAVLRETVDFVALPAFEGEMGVLPGHTALLVQLTAGALRIKKGDQVNFFSISGGFAEVHPGKIEVFAETAEMAGEIDVERARLAAEKAKGDLAKSATPQDMATAQAALRRALIRLRISEGMSKFRKK